MAAIPTQIDRQTLQAGLRQGAERYQAIFASSACRRAGEPGSSSPFSASPSPFAAAHNSSPPRHPASPTPATVMGGAMGGAQLSASPTLPWLMMEDGEVGVPVMNSPMMQEIFEDL